MNPNVKKKKPTAHLASLITHSFLSCASTSEMSTLGCIKKVMKRMLAKGRRGKGRKQKWAKGAK